MTSHTFFYQNGIVHTDFGTHRHSTFINIQGAGLAQSDSNDDTEQNMLLGIDQLNSSLLASKKNPVHAASYTAYGTVRCLQSRIGFTGALHDQSLATYLLGNGYRCYSPLLMRFYSPDSFSPFVALNSYAYCAGDPINNSDPSGHLPPIKRPRLSSLNTPPGSPASRRDLHISDRLSPVARDVAILEPERSESLFEAIESLQSDRSRSPVSNIGISSLGSSTRSVSSQAGPSHASASQSGQPIAKTWVEKNLPEAWMRHELIEWGVYTTAGRKLAHPELARKLALSMVHAKLEGVKPSSVYKWLLSPADLQNLTPELLHAIANGVRAKVETIQRQMIRRD